MTHCNQPTPTGHHCRYPIDRCPMHARRPELPPADAHKADARDPHALGRFAVERAATSTASPLQTARFIRAVTQLHGMGPGPMDQERALQEVALRGRIMNGQPPRDDREWAFAAEVFDDEAMLEFHRWERLPPCPHGVLPAPAPTPEFNAEKWSDNEDA
jgi:hypothetical protein